MFAFRPIIPLLALSALALCAADKWDLNGRLNGMQGHRATVKVTGPSNRSTVSTSTGTYHLGALPPGAYEVTPSHSDYHFTPESKMVTISTHDLGGVNFTAHRNPIPKFEISGRVSGLAPNQHATVKTTGKAIHTVTTRNDGTYTFTNCVPGTYTVRVTRTGYTFTPSFRTVAVTNHDFTDRDFTAHLAH